MRYAVCLGFRDWHLDHLDRCLASIRRARPAVPINIVDDDSDADVAASLDEIAQRHGAWLTALRDRRENWSRAVVLNEASKHAPARRSGDWFVFTDADMLFPRLWFDEAERAMASGPGTLWVTPSRDLEKGFFELIGGDVRAYEDDVLLELNSVPHPSTGQGGAMVVSADWFRRVGGFDEFYEVWGAEDNDLALRATWDGLAVQRLPAWVAHQWHRRDWPTPEQLKQVERNRDYLAARVREAGEGRPRVVRNQMPFWSPGT